MGLMTLSHAPSSDQFADTMTKSLSVEKFAMALQQLNLRAASATVKDDFIVCECQQRLLKKDYKHHLCFQAGADEKKMGVKVRACMTRASISEMVVKGALSIAHELAHDAAVRALACPVVEPEPPKETGVGVWGLMTAAGAGAMATVAAVRFFRKSEKKKYVRDVGVQAPCTYTGDRCKFLGHVVDHTEVGHPYIQKAPGCCSRRRRPGSQSIRSGVEREL